MYVERRQTEQCIDVAFYGYIYTYLSIGDKEVTCQSNECVQWQWHANLKL